MLMFGQSLQMFLLLKQKSYDLETWHGPSETQDLQLLNSLDPGLTLTYLTARANEKRDNKQCLLDTPVTITNKRLISKHKKSEKKLHIYKSHGNIKNYKGKLL